MIHFLINWTSLGNTTVATRPRAIRDRPLFTETHLSGFVPESGSGYFFGISPEERTNHVRDWQSSAKDVEFVEITQQNSSDFVAAVHGQAQRVSLRSKRQLDAFCKMACRQVIFLDINGLSHHIWAPLLRSA